MKYKSPFHSVDNMDIVSGSFNSNFSCKCQKTKNFVLGPEKYIFNCKVDSEKTDKPYSSHIDYSDMMTDSFILQPKFKFYQTHEFHKLVNNLSENKAFSVFHTNICSLQANFDNLQNLINNLDHQFSVVALYETWTPQNKNSLFKSQKLDGYQPYYGILGNSLKNGCGFYVKDEINYKPRKDLDIAYNDEYKEFQYCWIEIINQNNPNILVGTYYRHPKKNSSNVFLEKLKENLNKLGNNNKITIVAGDFNFDLLKYDYNNLTNDFLSIMYSNFFQPCILEPTRITSNNRPSLLDNIFINTHDKEVYSGNIIDKISDHIPNFAIINNIFIRKGTKR